MTPAEKLDALVAGVDPSYILTATAYHTELIDALKALLEDAEDAEKMAEWYRHHGPAPVSLDAARALIARIESEPTP